MVQSELLEIRGLSKSFPGVRALTDVDFSLKSGEIHALLGENGAGKSTLIKTLTGVYKKDAGKVFFDGKEFEAHSPAHAGQNGISTVYQEVNLIPGLSVAENIYLGREPMKYGNIDWKQMRAGAQKALAKLRIKLDVNQELSSCSIAIQQMVSIARALDVSAKVLILDEPTSSLDEGEVASLFEVMRNLRSQGIAIVFITHFLDQVYEICDRITVLRNSKLVGVFNVNELSKVDLVTHMLGKELDEESRKSHKKDGQSAGDVFMELKDVVASGLGQMNLKVRKGEVLGFAGLLGSGRTEVAEILFGIRKPLSGELLLNGKKTNLKNPRNAISHGIAFCPEDRRREGIIADLSVRENIILAIQARRGIFRTMSRKEQQRIVDKYIEELKIATPDAEQKVQFLSGGNQQKVILARWLASNPKFLILDEPTRGIDVGVKLDIQDLVGALSEEGMAVLFISSELEEVLRSSERVLVLRDRNIVDELTGEDINGAKVMHTIAEGSTDV
ncbi:MAG: sugar ABC transporter ATP-binding protein [Deltaproteobacteria bacterium]|nr:sugar ABC transporter ATP-binding protein [Deltaproteobacteria bacterium]